MKIKLFMFIVVFTLMFVPVLKAQEGKVAPQSSTETQSTVKTENVHSDKPVRKPGVLVSSQPPKTAPSSDTTTRSATQTREPDLSLTSPEFKNGQAIPKKFTCDGGDVNPPLNIQGVPKRTESLALVVDDPDAAGGWIHWILFNIEPNVKTIKQDSQPGDQGTNDFGRLSYGGPCPPAGDAHTYRFRLYALDIDLNVGTGVKKEGLEKAMKKHLLADAELTGTYKKEE